ncbi:hypothetical protein A4A49_51465 [Nicotiana attenuata]|uniref:Uncharacterized protein n=1 Tax=Nicotiana attenuata TaxID=49451 RepID=A0A314LGL9_NICAT|nr:hypothetical protein A4A49_51465 [Nicotiana attenuata]
MLQCLGCSFPMCSELLSSPVASVISNIPKLFCPDLAWLPISSCSRCVSVVVFLSLLVSQSCPQTSLLLEMDDFIAIILVFLIYNCVILIYKLAYIPFSFRIVKLTSSIGNIISNDSSNEVIQRLEQKIIELKEKQNEEMNMMKQNQEMIQSELLQMRQLMRKYAPDASMPQSSNGTSGELIPDAYSGHGRVLQTSRMPSVAENAQPSHGITHLCPSSLLFEFSSFDFY